MRYKKANHAKTYKYSYSLVSRYVNARDIQTESRICDILFATDVVAAYDKVNSIVNDINSMYKDIVFELEVLAKEEN